MSNNIFRTSRRSFFKSLAAMAAAAGLPEWYMEECLAGQAIAQEGRSSTSALDRLWRTGPRRCSQRHAAFGRIVAVCDVDEKHVAGAKSQFSGAEGYSDFRKLLERKDIDAVVCGTVDHWHTLVAIAAMRAGKDIYCEKPLTLTIDEGKHLVKVQEETGRILQTGTQQRSDVYFRLACDLVRNERIGKLQKVEVWLPAGLRPGRLPRAPCPRALTSISGKGRRRRSITSGSGRISASVTGGNIPAAR